MQPFQSEGEDTTFSSVLIWSSVKEERRGVVDERVKVGGEMEVA